MGIHRCLHLRSFINSLPNSPKIGKPTALTNIKRLNYARSSSTKFFEALGWDIYNQKGVAPEYSDVIIEDSLEIEGATKAPDYAFKIGRERKFYVEAKKTGRPP